MMSEMMYTAVEMIWTLSRDNQNEKAGDEGRKSQLQELDGDAQRAGASATN